MRKYAENEKLYEREQLKDYMEHNFKILIILIRVVSCMKGDN